MKLYDAAVIGGGVAGPALAIELGRSGRSVVLFEKEKDAHDKVCGEFISHEGVRYLRNLGVPVEGLGSVPIRHVRLAGPGDAVTAQLPFEAQSLSRRVLDESLLQLAAKSGVEIRRGMRIKDMEREGDAWAVHPDSADSVAAKQVFLATGKHDLKDWKRTRGQHPDCIAFKAYWRLQAGRGRRTSPPCRADLVSWRLCRLAGGRRGPRKSLPHRPQGCIHRPIWIVGRSLERHAGALSAS